jgi:hypothetical protein
MAETYYERLGVAPDASAEAVAQAYRARLKEVHPDVSDDPGAAERTRRLIEAKRVLTDDHERAVYDRIGHANYTASNGDASTTSDQSDRQERAKESSTTPPRGTAASSSARERRRRRNRETRAPWNDHAGVADGGRYARRWRAWKTDGAYRIHPTERSTVGSRLFPVGPSLVVLFVAFWLYPVLLWGTVEAAFPLVINLVLGGCLLAYVAYFCSMPPVGVAVFGTWAVLLPAVLAGAGAARGPALAVALVGTTVPLVIGTVVWAVMRA